MGLPFAPVYAEDIASAVEDIKKVIAKIDTNKFDKKDLLKLHDANAELIKAILRDEN